MTTSPPNQRHEAARSGRRSAPALLWRGVADGFLMAVCWFLAITALGIVAGALFVGVHGDGGWLSTFDARVNNWFGAHHTGWTVPLAKGAAVAGSVGGLAVITVGIGLVLWWIGWRVRAIVPFLAFAGAELVVFVAKEIISRHRPPSAAAHLYPWVHGVHETDLSFPSGHSTATAAVLLALAVLAVGHGARWWPWFVAVLVAAAMAAGRLVLGVHWFSDVSVGLVLGLMWGAAVASCLHEPDQDPRYAAPTVPG